MRRNSYIIISLLIFSLIIVIFFFQSPKNSENFDLELKKFDETSSEDIVKISSPIFKSKGLDTNTYTIKAEKGLQSDSNIELYKINATFEGENNKIFYVYADEGFYNQQDDTIELNKNVEIVDELKNKTFSKKAFINIRTKIITLSEEVISISANTSIKSDSSIVDDLNKTVTYLGNVKVQIEYE